MVERVSFYAREELMSFVLKVAKSMEPRLQEMAGGRWRIATTHATERKDISFITRS